MLTLFIPSVEPAGGVRHLQSECAGLAVQHTLQITAHEGLIGQRAHQLQDFFFNMICVRM